MINVRLQPPANAPRFNVLLTEDREHAPEHWTRQLPQILAPMGISATIARTGDEAVQVTLDRDIHAAIVDLATPRNDTADPTPGGLWVLEVLSRQPNCPPVVVVNSQTYSQRVAQRYLNQALRLGAFSVINRQDHGQINIDAMLNAIRKLIERNYQDHWPQT